MSETVLVTVCTTAPVSLTTPPSRLAFGAVTAPGVTEAAGAVGAACGPETVSEAQRAAWAVIERMAVRFALAERLLISTPMWNFGLPYKLKHYIDLINQPRLTFRFDPAIGFIPLLKDRPVRVIVACGGRFTGPYPQEDFLTPYLRYVLGVIGFTDIDFLLLEQMTRPEGQAAAAGPTEDWIARQLASFGGRCLGG